MLLRYFGWDQHRGLHSIQGWIRLVGIVALAALAAFLVAAPSLLNSFYLRVLTEALIYGLLAMSIDVLAGYTGLSTLGQAGIFGVSAYVAGYLSARMDQPMYVAFPAGILGALLISIVFGAVAIRTSGIYFLMITLAQGMIIWGLAYRWNAVTGAENGIRGIHRPEILGDYWRYYYVVLVSFVVLCALMYRVVNSPFGLTLKGIRESESRMRTLGYNVALHKFLGFTVAGALAGIAGGFYVYHNNFVSPATVEFGRSAEGLLMTILGGVGTLFGPAIGSLVVVFTRHQVSLYTDRWPMIMGAIFVVTILLAPDGLVGGTRRLLARVSQTRREPGLTAYQSLAGQEMREEVSDPGEIVKREASSTATPVD